MALWITESDRDLLTCPYDPIHQINRKNFCKHMQKCRNNPANGGQPREGLVDLVPCPAGCVLRMIPACDLSHHLKNCYSFKKMVIDQVYHPTQRDDKPIDYFKAKQLAAADPWRKDNNGEFHIKKQGGAPEHSNNMHDMCHIYLKSKKEKQVFYTRRDAEHRAMYTRKVMEAGGITVPEPPEADPANDSGIVVDGTELSKLKLHSSSSSSVSNLCRPCSSLDTGSDSAFKTHCSKESCQRCQDPLNYLPPVSDKTEVSSTVAETQGEIDDRAADFEDISDDGEIESDTNSDTVNLRFVLCRSKCADVCTCKQTEDFLAMNNKLDKKIKEEAKSDMQLANQAIQTVVDEYVQLLMRPYSPDNELSKLQRVRCPYTEHDFRQFFEQPSSESSASDVKSMKSVNPRFRICVNGRGQLCIQFNDDYLKRSIQSSDCSQESKGSSVAAEVRPMPENTERNNFFTSTPKAGDTKQPEQMAVDNNASSANQQLFKTPIGVPKKKLRTSDSSSGSKESGLGITPTTSTNTPRKSGVEQLKPSHLFQTPPDASKKPKSSASSDSSTASVEKTLERFYTSLSTKNLNNSNSSSYQSPMMEYLKSKPNGAHMASSSSSNGSSETSSADESIAKQCVNENKINLGSIEENSEMESEASPVVLNKIELHSPQTEKVVLSAVANKQSSTV